MSINLYIDSGVNNLGYAIGGREGLLHSGVQTVPRLTRVSHWTRKCDIQGELLCEKLADLGLFNTVYTVFIEVPSVWEGNAISKAASAKGDLMKLTWSAGVLAGYLSATGVFERGGIKDVFPYQWKGQLSKQNVITRIRRHLPEQFGSNPPRDHEADAIGIYLWNMGKL